MNPVVKELTVDIFSSFSVRIRCEQFSSVNIWQVEFTLWECGVKILNNSYSNPTTFIRALDELIFYKLYSLSREFCVKNYPEISFISNRLWASCQGVDRRHLEFFFLTMRGNFWELSLKSDSQWTDVIELTVIMYMEKNILKLKSLSLRELYCFFFISDPPSTVVNELTVEYL